MSAGTVLSKQEAALVLQLQEEAEAVEKEFLANNEQMARNAMRNAVLCYQVKVKELYKYRGFQSPLDWALANGCARSTYFRWTKIVEALESRLTHAQIQEIPQVNAEKLIQLPESKRFLAENIEAAKSDKADDFEKKVRAQQTALEQGEDKDWIRFKATLSQRDVIRQAREKACVDHDLDPNDTAGQYEAIASDYLLSSPEILIAWREITYKLQEAIKEDQQQNFADKYEAAMNLLGDIAEIQRQVR